MVYGTDGRATYVQGRDVYMDAVMNDNLHDLTEGAYFMYFLHNTAPRKIGDTWQTDMFSYPLTEHIPMTLTFSKVEATPEGKSATRVDISGTMSYPKHMGMILTDAYEMNLTGDISGYMHVDMKTNRILRIKAVLNLKGKVTINNKEEDYTMEVKINEWEMNPLGK